MTREIRERYEKHFANHKATMVLDQDDFKIIDWRRQDGSSEYYVRFIVDIQRGSLIIQGDLGFCIACWYNRVELEDMVDYVTDVGYFMTKFRCTSADYTYDIDDLISDYRDEIKELVDQGRLDPEDEQIDKVVEAMEEQADLYEKTGYYDSEICDAFHELDPDWWDTFPSHLGRRIHPRVYLWVIGFQMACEQLENNAGGGVESSEPGLQGKDQEAAAAR